MFVVRPLLIMLSLAIPSVAMGSAKVALVIGNSGYEHVARLKNPVGDAKAIGAALRKLGFQVTEAYDLSFDGLRRSLRAFSFLAERADIAIVFYAGHGIEVEKRNFLIPVDARLERENDVKFETIPLDLVLQSVVGAKKLSAVILDACRDNPFLKSMKLRSGRQRSINRGLAKVDPPVGNMLVAFAAQAGRTADDGNDRHSPYTSALLRHISKPIDVQFIFRRVHDDVLRQTNRRQRPVWYGLLGGKEIFLNRSSRPRKNSVQKSLAPEKKPDLSPRQKLWNAVKGSKDASRLELFLSIYPKGKFSEDARRRLAELKAPRETTSDPHRDPIIAIIRAKRPLGEIRLLDKSSAHDLTEFACSPWGGFPGYRECKGPWEDRQINGYKLRKRTVLHISPADLVMHGVTVWEDLIMNDRDMRKMIDQVSRSLNMKPIVLRSPHLKSRGRRNTIAYWGNIRLLPVIGTDLQRVALGQPLGTGTKYLVDYELYPRTSASNGNAVYRIVGKAGFILQMRVQPKNKKLTLIERWIAQN